jgi:hypothetical protein
MTAQRCWRMSDSLKVVSGKRRGCHRLLQVGCDEHAAHPSGTTNAVAGRNIGKQKSLLVVFEIG